jgi:phage terminase large subunit-like protein
MYDTLKYSGAARVAPLFIITTTAGVVDEASVCFEQYTYAKGVRDGSIDDDSFFATIFEAPAGLALDDPAAWRAANPNLGITILEDEIAQQATAAQQTPAMRSAFERYRLNRWQNQTQAFLDLATWDDNDAHPILEAEYVGARAVAGLDLAAVSDLNALVYLFPCRSDPEAVDVICRAWLPRGALAKNRNAHLYQQWADEGALVLTDGDVSDYTFIRTQILADAARWVIDGIGVDRLFQGLEHASSLADEGVTIAPIGQGFLSMGPLMQELERLALAKRLHHGGHGPLRWCIGNLQVRTDPAGNHKPSRESAVQKVDLAVALLMGLDRHLRRSRTPAEDLQPSFSIW